MTLKKKQAGKKPFKKTERSALELIQTMPLRRSRAEQNRHHMMVKSYPHALIGNVAQFFDTSIVESALKTEREMGLLDIITCINLSRENGKLQINFLKHTIDMTQRRIEQQCADNKPTTAFQITCEDSETIEKVVSNDAIIDMLLKAYHSVSVGGRTNRMPMTSNNWIISSGLTLEPGKGFAGIRIEADTNQSLEQVTDLLKNTFKREAFSISFTQAAIMAQGESTRFISYEGELVKDFQPQGKKPQHDTQDA